MQLNKHQQQRNAGIYITNTKSKTIASTKTQNKPTDANNKTKTKHQII